MLAALCFCVFYCCPSAARAAGPAHLVQDLLQRPSTLDIATPEVLQASSEQAFFYSYNPDIGIYIGSTDGTSPVQPLCRYSGYSPEQGIKGCVTNTSYYFASNLTGNFALWKTDGTSTGTSIAFDPGQQNLITSVVALGNKACFIDALQDQYGNYSQAKLWSTEGTPDSTQLLNSGASYILYGDTDTLYFCNQSQLWKTDGTASGTSFICNMPSLATPVWACKLGNLIYSCHGDGYDNDKIYKTDLDAKNVTQIATAYQSLSAAEYNGMLYFTKSDGVYRLDPTSDSISLLETEDSSFYPYLTRLGGGIAFLVYYRNPYYTTTPKWCYFDSTSLSSTTFFQGATASGEVRIMSATSSTLCFRQFYALYTSNGTSAGTHAVATDSSGLRAAVVRDRVIYGGVDKYLWSRDAVSGGNPKRLSGIPQLTDSSNAQVLAPWKGALLMIAAQSTGYGLFNIPPGGAPAKIATLSGGFLPALKVGSELWFSPGIATDGTVTGTRTLPVSFLALGAALDGYVYYSNYGATSPYGMYGDGLEPWRTNGTEEATTQVANLNESLTQRCTTPCCAFCGTCCGYSTEELGSEPYNFTTFNNSIFFAAMGNVFRTTNSQAGATQISNLPADGALGPFVSFDGMLYFIGWNAGSSGLYRTDGIATNLVRQFGSAAWESRQTLVAANGALYFAASETSSGEELWTSDGTADGSHIVADIAPGAQSSLPRSITAMANKLLFSANDGVNGEELWTTDGTSVGTYMLKDISPGALGSTPSNFSVLGSTAFFSADDLIHGRELWSTDGSPAGTSLFQDLNNGLGGSDPSVITLVGKYAYFICRGNDGLSYSPGREPWVIEVSGADLSISQFASESITTVGESLDYTIDVVNRGPQISGITTVVDELPPNCLLIDATQSSGTHDVAGNSVTFHIGTLHPDASAQLHVIVQPTIAGDLVNIASISGDAIDPAAANNSTSVTTLVRSSDGTCPPVNIAFAIEASGKCKGAGDSMSCKLRATALLSNITTGPLSEPKIPVCFYLSDDAVLDPSDSLIQTRMEKRPKPGRSKTVKLSKVLPHGKTAAGKFVIALIDCDQPIIGDCDNEFRIQASGPMPAMP